VNENQQIIINFLKNNPHTSSKEIMTNAGVIASYATIKRLLQSMATEGLLEIIGKGKSTKYAVSPVYELIEPISVDTYFKNEIDERKIINSFNYNIFKNLLSAKNIFSNSELGILEKFHVTFKNRIAKLSKNELKKDLERLAIDLSWKSSQIEGNTYSLLETERLLKEKETAEGKTQEEAFMLLNHKEAIDFIIQHPDYFFTLTISNIEDIHKVLVQQLDIDINVRNKKVGISGTNYKPLDNQFQIKEAMTSMCEIVNQKENVFEKALLTLILLSYIQPFMDGNKRTSRIVSNAVLLSYGYCPLSYRTVNSIDYKKAMLLFYEQNNLSAFKNIFIGQYQFAVENYF